MAANSTGNSPRARTSGGFTLVLLLIVAALWWSGQLQPRDSSSPATRTPPTTAPAAKTGTFETHRNCTLVAARNNDGDSFMVRLPDGRERELRLYYVDTPESAFKRYAGGETNHERIRQQAAELGGITPEQAVEIGKQAKAYTLALLEARPFTIHTIWDSPFQDNRFHAFVAIEQPGGTRWLHELLLERGLVRLKTKPAPLPDGTPVETHRRHLKDLEAQAKRARAGAWGR